MSEIASQLAAIFSGVMFSPVPRATPMVSWIMIRVKTPAPAPIITPLGASSDAR